MVETKTPIICLLRVLEKKDQSLGVSGPAVKEHKQTIRCSKVTNQVEITAGTYK